MLMTEYELMELEAEDFEDYEFEDDELEADPFLGGMLKSPVFKRLARRAARVAGQAIAGRRGADIASAVAQRVIREAELEGEYESEAEFEAEFEALGGDPELLAEMEYLAELAAEAESEAEADEFLGALASMAGPLISSLLGEAEWEDELDYELYEDEADPFLGAIMGAAKSLIPKVVPFVRRGIQTVGKFLRRPSTRSAIRSVPRMVARTAVDLRKMAQRGRPITPTSAAAVFGGNVARTLSSRRSMRRRGRRRFGLGRRRPRHRGRVIRPRYCVL